MNAAAEGTKAAPPKFKQKETRQFKSKAPKAGQKGWDSFSSLLHQCLRLESQTPAAKSSRSPLTREIKFVLIHPTLGEDFTSCGVFSPPPTGSITTSQGWRVLEVRLGFMSSLERFCVHMFSLDSCSRVVQTLRWSAPGRRLATWSWATWLSLESCRRVGGGSCHPGPGQVWGARSKLEEGQNSAVPGLQGASNTLKTYSSIVSSFLGV